MNIGIYIYDKAEVLDFSGPFEVFTTASRIFKGNAPFKVFLISQSGTTVSARAGYSVNPDYGFHNHPNLDILIISGGYHYDETENKKVIKWIYNQGKETSYIASVCTGVFLLAEAGIITNEKVTTHWSDIDELREKYPNLTVCEDSRWVDQGRIITSAGISAGIDMSLYLVSRLHSMDLAEKTALQMEYDWNP